MKSFKEFILNESVNKQTFLEKYRENKDKAINAIRRLLSKAKKLNKEKKIEKQKKKNGQT